MPVLLRTRRRCRVCFVLPLRLAFSPLTSCHGNPPFSVAAERGCEVLPRVRLVLWHRRRHACCESRRGANLRQASEHCAVPTAITGLRESHPLLNVGRRSAKFSGMIRLDQPISSVRRWTSDIKRAIMSSRLTATGRITAAIAACAPERRPKALLSASAVGFYGTSTSARFDEDSAAGADYLAQARASSPLVLACGSFAGSGPASEDQDPGPTGPRDGRCARGGRRPPRPRSPWECAWCSSASGSSLTVAGARWPRWRRSSRRATTPRHTAGPTQGPSPPSHVWWPNTCTHVSIPLAAPTLTPVLSPRIVLRAHFQVFAGGAPGDGRQWFSWVHRDDCVEAIFRSLTDESIQGPVNVTSPRPVRMQEMCTALGAVMGRPSWLPVPEFAIQVRRFPPASAAQEA